MNDTHLENYLNSQIPDFYSFAYILLPDNLQATQLVVDATSALLIGHKSLVKKWVNLSKGEFILNQADVKREIYRLLYSLAEVRYHQVIQSFKEEEERFDFYKLSLIKKASLYLREKCDYSVELIGYILDQNQVETLAQLQTSRVEMFNTLSNL